MEKKICLDFADFVVVMGMKSLSTDGKFLWGG